MDGNSEFERLIEELCRAEEAAKKERRAMRLLRGACWVVVALNIVKLVVSLL